MCQLLAVVRYNMGIVYVEGTAHMYDDDTRWRNLPELTMVALLFPLNTAVPKGQRHVHLKRPVTMAEYLVELHGGGMRVQRRWAANGEDGRGRLPHRFLLPSPIIGFGY